MSPARFAPFAEEVREHGVVEDLLITPDYEIANGRHRWRAMSVKPHLSQACLPCRVVSEEDVARIILDTTLARRHFGKGARAFMSMDLIAKAVLDGQESRKRNLIPGNKSGQNPRGAKSTTFEKNGSVGLAELADQLGISEALLKQARAVETCLAKSDAILDKWKDAHPDALESWLEWEDKNPEAKWQDFRLSWLSDNKLSGAADHSRLIPEDYRSIYTDRIFAEADETDGPEFISLGNALKALGSLGLGSTPDSTKGKARPDLDPENKAPHIQMENKLVTFAKTMWTQTLWGALSGEQRIALAGKVSDNVLEWPDEVKHSVLAKLRSASGKKVVKLGGEE
jgi:hypothetical protein